MAISKEEREILESFYQKNKNLMNAIMVMMMDDDDVEPGLKAQMASYINSKDYTKYEFDGSIYPKNKLVLAIVKRYVKDYKPKDFSELNLAFPKALQGSHGVIKKYSELSQNEKKYKRFFVDSGDIITLQDKTECVVCSQWGTGNIEKLLEKASEYKYIIDVA